jgi:hypothetical protein
VAGFRQKALRNSMKAPAYALLSSMAKNHRYQAIALSHCQMMLRARRCRVWATSVPIRRL